MEYILSKDHLIEGQVVKKGSRIVITEGDSASFINNKKINSRDFPAETLNDMKLMPINDFRRLGYLQEVNRRFLHPLGLALIAGNDEEGNWSITGVWDSREDSEGIYFGLNDTTESRLERFQLNKEFIDSELNKRIKAREEKLGFIIEPIE